MARLIGWLGWALVFAIAWFSLFSTGRAHMADRPDLNDWFAHLRSPGGGLCCSVVDGETLTDVQWDTQDGHYRVFLDGQWRPVPDNAVVQTPNRLGQAIVWPIRYGQGVIGIRCFMPGAGT